MKHYFGLFHQLTDDNELNLHPFIFHKVGPSWFTQTMIPSSSKTQKKVISYDRISFQASFFFKGLSGEDYLGINYHAPNTICQQFGFVQSIPAPIFSEEHLHLDNAKVPYEDHFVNAQEDNKSRWNLYYLVAVSLCIFTTQSFQINGSLIIKASLHLWKHALIE